MILVEPTMMTRAGFARFIESDAGSVLLRRAEEAAKTRKDTWPSRADAHAWLARRAPWKHWDARVLQDYVVRPSRT